MAKTPITAFRLTREDKDALDELVVLLGRLARRNCEPHRYTAAEALRDAVYTRLADLKAKNL